MVTSSFRIGSFIMAVLWLCSCSRFLSDEALLRNEYGIPVSAECIFSKVHPEPTGEWFGREGLRIHMVFQLNEADFEKMVSKARKSGTWRPMPIPRDFLMRMGGIRSSKEGLKRVYDMTGEDLPEEGSVYNPSEEQRYERFVRTLPLDVAHGLYQCRSAGNDIMHARKTVHVELDRDLNDFMLAILDLDKERIVIKVGTKY